MKILQKSNIVVIGEKNILESGNKFLGKSPKLVLLIILKILILMRIISFLDISQGKNHQYNLSECSKESGESVLSH